MERKKNGRNSFFFHFKSNDFFFYIRTLKTGWMDSNFFSRDQSNSENFSESSVLIFENFFFVLM